MDESDLCFEAFPPGPLSGIFGLEVEECDALYPGEPVSVQGLLEGEGVAGKDVSAAVSDFQDVIRNGFTAEPVCRFSGGLADGKPAVLRNSYGKGCGWYLAGRLELGFLRALYRDISREAGVDTVHRDLLRKSPAVLIKERKSPDGRRYRFLLNFSPESGFVEFAGGEGQFIELGPWGAEILGL